MTLGDAITKVPNRNAGGGCTVDDFINDEGTWSTHAAFVNHVEQATETLDELGVLSSAEAAELNAAAAASPIGKPGTTGYEALFDGTAESLRAWEQAPSGQFTLQPDGSIRSAGGLGMLWYAQRQFGDFSVKLQFKDIAPDPNRANSGVFVRFPDPRTPLDAAATGQLRDGRLGADVAGVGRDLLRSRDPDLRR